MSQPLSQAQRRFQSLKNQERKKKETMNQMFVLAGEMKRVRPEQKIDDFQAKVLWNVAKTLEMKRKKGLL